MKNFKQPAIYLYIAILSMFFLGSCDLNNTDTPEKPANQYLISSEVAGSITRDQALPFLQRNRLMMLSLSAI